MQLQTPLVILLSAGFLVLLLLGIVLLVILISIFAAIHRITKKAEQASDNITDAFVSVGKKVAPLALTTVIGTFIRRMRKRSKEG